jgi:hypothetical protein
MSAHDVIGELETQAPWHTSRAEAMAAQIRGDQPLRRDTDLRLYGLREWELRGIPEQVAASLLDRGKATVLDLWEAGESEALEAVQVSHIELAGSQFLEVCNWSGESILRITLSVAD